MTNAIIEALAVLLDSKFSNVKIYTNYVEQGFKPPCFFIYPLNVENKKELSSVIKKTLTINIIYYPVDSNEMKKQMLEALNIMLEEMSILELNGKKIRGRNMSGEISEDNLNFTVSYSYRFMKNEKAEYMQNLKQKRGVKNG